MVIDGVLVMVGRKNGFVVKLKDVNFCLILVYCVCYKLVLVCIDVKDNGILKFIKEVEIVVI